MIKDEILELRNHGFSYKEIKKLLGCSSSTIAYHCGEGQKEKSKIRTQRQRDKVADWLVTYKSNLSCCKCGKSHPAFIDFHHNENNKKDSVSHIVRTSSITEALKEIEKCEAICVNCHRKEHKIIDGSQKYLQDSTNPGTQCKRELVRWFIEYKSTLKCEKCGESESCCLDFHHKDRKSKEAIVGQCAYKGWSKKRILLEIEKCDVLCGNCHRLLHWEDQGYTNLYLNKQKLGNMV